jgi:hypothetical protein
MYTVLETQKKYTDFITEGFKEEIYGLNTQLCSLKARFEKIKIFNIEKLTEDAIENKLDMAFDDYILCLYDNLLESKDTDKKFMEHYESLVVSLKGGVYLLKELNTLFNEIKSPVNIYVFRRYLKHLKRDFFCRHLLKLYNSARSLNDSMNNIISLKKYFSWKNTHIETFNETLDETFEKIIHAETKHSVDTFFEKHADGREIQMTKMLRRGFFNHSFRWGYDNRFYKIYCDYFIEKAVNKQLDQLYEQKGSFYDLLEYNRSPIVLKFIWQSMPKKLNSDQIKLFDPIIYGHDVEYGLKNILYYTQYITDRKKLIDFSRFILNEHGKKISEQIRLRDMNTYYSLNRFENFASLILRLFIFECCAHDFNKPFLPIFLSLSAVFIVHAIFSQSYGVFDTKAYNPAKLVLSIVSLIRELAWGENVSDGDYTYPFLLSCFKCAFIFNTIDVMVSDRNFIVGVNKKRDQYELPISLYKSFDKKLKRIAESSSNDCINTDRSVFEGGFENCSR